MSCNCDLTSIGASILTIKRDSLNSIYFVVSPRLREGLSCHQPPGAWLRALQIFANYLDPVHRTLFCVVTHVCSRLREGASCHQPPGTCLRALQTVANYLDLVHNVGAASRRGTWINPRRRTPFNGPSKWASHILCQTGGSRLCSYAYPA